ncbi:hypothetical protein IE4872_PD00512 (plasmid) [Rhizobium gallicum]|uniref:Uncharacterized protein n=1 Tax=Rhizobium gallicum TaxID=56730 RepID=A0A1L5NT17_9HYPH|nr:hypothetical protein IE4872_PD00512 [Rhizobium gallicum]
MKAGPRLLPAGGRSRSFMGDRLTMLSPAAQHYQPRIAELDVVGQRQIELGLVIR